MAAHDLYIAKSAAVAGTTLKGFVSVSVSVDAQTVSPRGDGLIYKQKTCVVGVDEKVDIEAEDCGTAPAIGATGALSIVGAKLAGGATQTGTLTIAASACTVTAVSRSINMDGKPTLRISVSVESADGAATGLTYTAA